MHGCDLWCLNHIGKTVTLSRNTHPTIQCTESSWGCSQGYTEAAMLMSSSEIITLYKPRAVSKVSFYSKSGGSFTQAFFVCNTWPFITSFRHDLSPWSLLPARHCTNRFSILQRINYYLMVVPSQSTETLMDSQSAARESKQSPFLISGSNYSHSNNFMLVTWVGMLMSLQPQFSIPGTQFVVLGIVLLHNTCAIANLAGSVVLKMQQFSGHILPIGLPLRTN